MERLSSLLMGAEGSSMRLEVQRQKEQSSHFTIERRSPAAHGKDSLAPEFSQSSVAVGAELSGKSVGWGFCTKSSATIGSRDHAGDGSGASIKGKGGAFADAYSSSAAVNVGGSSEKVSGLGIVFQQVAGQRGLLIKGLKEGGAAFSSRKVWT